MLDLICLLMTLGLGQGALVLSSYGKDERVALQKTGGLCGSPGMLYCNQPRAYPRLAIKRALRRQTTMLDMFELQAPAHMVKRSTDDFYEACPSTHMTILPRVGTNTNNQQRYLVNGAIIREDRELVQQVQVTTCDGPGDSCSAGGFGVRTECRQQFSHHRLVALDMERGELVVETFTFPSCCSCMVQRAL
jgi:hypothetical protein